MMIKVAAVAVIGAAVSVVLRHIKPEYCIGVAIACFVIIMMMIKDDIAAVIDTMLLSANEMGIDSVYVTLIIKIIGVAYLTQFASSICEDAGEKAIAMKVEFAGRISIILMSAPLMFAVINLISGILP
ncbi:MAG: hypothetical protein M0R40_02375 [Firmicutes bacterium]|nr:hypothetical protein [Bacillota bacterium]